MIDMSNVVSYWGRGIFGIELDRLLDRFDRASSITPSNPMTR